jgi:hypothetical protein
MVWACNRPFFFERKKEENVNFVAPIDKTGTFPLQFLILSSPAGTAILLGEAAGLAAQLTESRTKSAADEELLNQS